ncbi:MAG: hypothetical protein KF758_07715 [Anaerolineales bacterium]|nr:hypothetical protein [Anaerolineales bacterium]MBX3036785.1 hypothetical protein [Anaerolineales bacterium]
MKKSIMVIVVTVILFVLLSTWNIKPVSAPPYQHPKPSITPEILENGQYRFADDEVGYSFTYAPQTLSISVGNDRGEQYNHLSVQFAQIDGYGYQGMILYVLPNPNQLSLNEFLLKEFTGRWTKKTPQPNISESDLGEYFTVDGQPAIKTSIPFYIETGGPFSVFIQNGDTIISMGPMYGLMKASELAPETVVVFERILKTMSFTP